MARPTTDHEIHDEIPMRILLALLLAFFSALALTSCDTAHAMRVELSPAAGASGQYEISIRQEISQKAMGQSIDSRNTMTYGWTQTVGESDGNAIVIDVTYDWVKADLELPPPAQSIRFDSRKPSEPSPQTAGFVAIVGKGFKVRVTPTGEILSVEGIREMLDAMLAEMQTDSNMLDAMRESLKRQFGDESLKEMMQPFMTIYPPGEVSVGDTWTRQHVVNTMYPHVQDNTYELLEENKGLLKVAVDSKIRSKDEGSVVDMGMMKFDFTMDGTQKGTLTLDPANGGLVQGSRLESNLKGSMKVIGQDAMEPWPITIHQVMSYVRVN